MKIRNTKTGEIIDLSAPGKPVETAKAETPNAKPNQVERFNPKGAKSTEERIKERGTIQDSIKKIGEPGAGKKILGVLQVAASPFAAIESGLANPALNIQKGDINPIHAVKEAILGLSLQKQGQYGDIMKNAGYNPILADTAGLIASVSPLKAMQGVSKTFGNISKMSDKGLMKAGANLITAVQESRYAVGLKVGQEFANGADKVPVDGLKFLDGVSELPAPIMKKVEIAFGNLEDFAKGLTVGKVREFKRFLGKLKPNSYGQAEHGIQETLDVKDLNKAYGNVKNSMETALRDPLFGLDEKTVDHLMGLEESYHDVMNAGRFIKKTIVDSTLNVPTKVGEFAKKISAEGDSTARLALSTIKKSSRKAMGEVNKAMERIESYNKWQQGKQLASRAFNAVTYGGIAGGIGGKILRSAQDKE